MNESGEREGGERKVRRARRVTGEVTTLNDIMTATPLVSGLRRVRFFHLVFFLIAAFLETNFVS